MWIDDHAGTEPWRREAILVVAATVRTNELARVERGLRPHFEVPSALELLRRAGDMLASLDTSENEKTRHGNDSRL